MNQKVKVRAALVERMRMGKSIESLLQSLAKRAPSTLIDIAIGLDPLGGPVFTRALLPLLHEIESRLASFPITPLHFYQRLADTSEDATPELLEYVISFHPTEAWVCVLSSHIEGSMASKTHLLAVQDEPYFREVCSLYVQHGVRKSLLFCAESLGRVEPGLAFISEGNLEVGLQAAALALKKDPDCGMIEYMCALIGPDIDLPLSNLITQLSSPSLLNHIEPLVKWYPRAYMALKNQKKRLNKEPS